MAEKGYEFTPDQASDYLTNFQKFVKMIKGMSQNEIFDMLEKIKESDEPTLFGEPLNEENTEKILRLFNDVKDH